jgi:delta 1-pyrroline-5-carboxylate dehydrogenase
MVGDSPAPLLAADTADVLKEAGVDDETVALLVAAAG